MSNLGPFEQFDPEQPFEDEGEKLLFYGMPGTGKTLAAYTAPDPILGVIIGPRNELKVLRSPAYRDNYKREIYPVNVIEKLGRKGVFVKAKAYDEATDYIDKAVELRQKGEFPSSTGSFRSIVIDNATVLYYYAMFKVLELGPSGTASKESRAAKILRDNNILVPVDYDYKGEMSLAYQLYSWLYQIEDLNVILIAHEHVETINKGGGENARTKEISKICAAFTGRNRDSIPGLFDNVWRFTTSGGGFSTSYQARTVGDEVVSAKTRVGGVLPEFYPNVNLMSAIEKLQKAQSRTRK